MLFLVRIDKTNFWTRTDADGVAYGSPYPSAAAHLTYERADEVCRQLRELGYHAIVTNISGRPASLTELAEARTYAIRSALQLDSYFMGTKNDTLIVTRDLAKAFRGSYSIVMVVAADLQLAGHRVEVVDVTNADPRQTDEYRKLAKELLKSVNAGE